MVKVRDDRLRILSAQLDTLLRTDKTKSQQFFANKSGVNQATVSRALAGDLVRVTRKIERLIRVVSHNYAEFRKQSPSPTKSIQAVIGHYLAEGGDPALLIEQVDVLRRAGERPRRAQLGEN